MPHYTEDRPPLQCCGGGSSGPPPSKTLPRATEVGGLPGVLKAGREEAHPPHAHGGQWLVLRLVELTVEFYRCEPAYEGFGARRDAVMIVQQELSGGDTKGRHVRWC